MKINEILVESNLEEGPILNKIGTGIGKAVGAAGKAAGAVAGGVAGLGSAFKKGYQAGKGTVATGGDDPGTGGAAAGVAKGVAQATGTAAAGSDTKDLMSKIDSLPVDAKRDLVNKIQTSIQSAPKEPAAEPAAAPTAGAGSATAGTTPSGQPKVEPDLKTPAGAAPAATGSAPATAAPAATGTATAQAKPAAPQNKAASDPYEKIKGEVRKAQGGTKPIPDNILQGINKDLARMGQGDKDMGANVGQRILQLAKQGYDVSNAQTTFVGASKRLTQSVYRAINNMLKEHGLKWSDLNLKITVSESTDKYVYVSQIKPLVESKKVQLFRIK